MRLVLANVALLLVMTAACSVFRHAAVQPIKIEGIAMEPALKNGDRILTDRNVDLLQRGDIVVFYFPLDPRKSYIKRIVGLPGEIVEVRDGKVIINGAPLDEPYVDPRNNQLPDNRAEIRVPADNYYVIGDNRDNSSDSRIWGLLQRKFIYGKFVKKYYSAS